MLRGTQHPVRADDYWWLRRLIEPTLARGRQAAFGRKTAGLDLAELAAAATELLTGRTLTGLNWARRWPVAGPTSIRRHWPGRHRRWCRWCTRRPTAPGGAAVI
ncbi:DNA glycosylase AlkZ-like family protein [Nonomuraea sp. NPDC050383]|uniref:DNA glycosylase AlkZ-like family protein n=1 Tax=Nonomuraea sp. NPDC050383 TaxID=3364362 RepID=UPI003794E765